MPPRKRATAPPPPPARRDYGSGSIYQPAGRSRWVVAIPYPDPETGERRKRTLRADSKQEAELLLAREIGKSGKQHARADTAPKNVRELRQKWLDEIDPKLHDGVNDGVTRPLPSTWRDYEGVLYFHVEPALGGVLLADLDSDVMKAFILGVSQTKVRRSGKTLSHYRQRTVFRVVSQMFKYGVGKGWMPSHPMTGLVAAGPGSERRSATTVTEVPLYEKALTAREQKKVLTWFRENYPASSYELKWELSFTLGLRQAECLGLTWNRLNFTTGTLTVAQQQRRYLYQHGCGTQVGRGVYPCSVAYRIETGKPNAKLTGHRCPKRIDGSGGLFIVNETKTSHQRENTVPAELLAKLKLLHDKQVLAATEISAAEKKKLNTVRKLGRYPAKSADLIFRDEDGRPLDASRDWQFWQDALAACDIPARTVHASRHSAATTLVNGGAPLTAVAALLGHSTLSQTAKYVGTAAPEQAQALALAAAYRARETSGDLG